MEKKINPGTKDLSTSDRKPPGSVTSVSGGIEEKVEYPELEKSKSYIIVEIIEYIPNSVVSKTIIKKSTGCNEYFYSISQQGVCIKIAPLCHIDHCQVGQA